MQNHQNKTKPYEDFESFEEVFSQAEKRPGYWEERAKLEFTREILDEMKRSGVSRTELAARLDVGQAMITRLLTGKNNFELATMVRLALALNCRFRSHLHPLEVGCMWLNVLKEEPKIRKVTNWNPNNFQPIQSASTTCEEMNYVSLAANT